MDIYSKYDWWIIFFHSSYRWIYIQIISSDQHLLSPYRWTRIYILPMCHLLCRIVRDATFFPIVLSLLMNFIFVFSRAFNRMHSHLIHRCGLLQHGRNTTWNFLEGSSWLTSTTFQPHVYIKVMRSEKIEFVNFYYPWFLLSIISNKRESCWHLILA